MKYNQLKVGSFLSYFQMGLSIIIGLVYTPVMVKLLGQSEYGLYNTVSSTISMLSILSLGFSSGYVRYYTLYKKEDKQEEIRKLNGLFLLVFLIIGGVALLCGSYLTKNLHLVFDQGLTPAEYKTAGTLMILLTVRLAISFPMSVFSSIITVHERFVFLKLLNILNTVMSPLITLPLLLMGYRSVAMVAVTLAIAIVVDICYLYYVLVVLKQRFVFHDFPKGLFRGVLGYTIFIAINMIVDQINWNVAKILLTRFKGTTAVAIYSVGYTLYHYYSMFSTAVSHVFTPRIHKVIANTECDLAQQRRQLTSLFTKVGRIQFIILGLIASGVIFFGKVFMDLWVGPGYYESYYVAVLLMLSASIALTQNAGIEIQRAKNKHQFRSYAYIAMAIINLVSSIFLCQKYGAIGSAVGTAISLVVANGLIMNVYYHKKCNIDILAFWKSMMRLSLGILPAIVCGCVITNVFSITSWGSMFAGAIGYSAVYCLSMWLLGLNAYEKDLIRKPLGKLLRKWRR